MAEQLNPSSTLAVQIKRAYEREASSDGTRVLVDRLWPARHEEIRSGRPQVMNEIAPQ